MPTDYQTGQLEQQLDEAAKPAAEQSGCLIAQFARRRSGMTIERELAKVAAGLPQRG
jgi:hypothetical protein